MPYEIDKFTDLQAFGPEDPELYCATCGGTVTAYQSPTNGTFHVNPCENCTDEWKLALAEERLARERFMEKIQSIFKKTT